MEIGVVVCSFALSDNEPNPTNIRLAKENERIVKKYEKAKNKVIVVCQWEVALALGKKPFHIVEAIDGVYLSSDTVIDEAEAIFRRRGISHVIVVANPFLHLGFCQRRLRKAGFNIIKEKIKKIGFYKHSLQWWTRNPWGFILYGIRLKLLGKRG